LYRLYVRNFVLSILYFNRDSKLKRDFGGLLWGVDFRHKIMLENFRNALEEGHVYGFTLEDIVNVLPMAIQPARKLAHAQTCIRQMFFYPFASVYIHSFAFKCLMKTSLPNKNPLSPCKNPQFLNIKQHYFVATFTAICGKYHHN
jgi:hypothetical protein